MKILILGIGKTKQSFLIEGINQYIKQTSPYMKVEELYLKEETDRPDGIDLECDKLLKAIPNGYFKILLERTGKQLSSEELAATIESIMLKSLNGIVFIIGGHLGVNEALKKEVDLLFSFSKATFTHQMVRLFLTEQIYRAYTIINNKTYHR